MANKIESICEIFVLIFLCFWASTYNAVKFDTLNQGEVLDSTASLTSNNGQFVLRFRDMSSGLESPPRWHLTLYGSFCSRNYLWVANRDRPIADNLAVLALDETGELIIRYGDNDAIALYSNKTSSKVAAILQDDGNFVLKQVNSGEILWQSFDNPTDSFLPGMKLGISKKTGKKRSLTSWLTDSLPTPGAFTLEWDPVRRELIVFRRGEVFWTSGKLGNNRFANTKMDSDNADYSFDVVSNNDGEYLTYKMVANQFIPRNWTNITGLRLLHNGSPVDQRSRKVILDSDLCAGDSTYGGCERWKETACRRPGDKLKRKKHSYAPNTVVYNNASLSLIDCKKMCWKNCSCVGVQDFTSNGPGCIFLHGTYRETENGMLGEFFYIIIKAPSVIFSLRFSHIKYYIYGYCIVFFCLCSLLL